MKTRGPPRLGGRPAEKVKVLGNFGSISRLPLRTQRTISLRGWRRVYRPPDFPLRDLPLLPPLDPTTLDELLGGRICPRDFVAAWAGRRGAPLHIVVGGAP
jgi:hypothetical protein